MRLNRKKLKNAVLILNTFIILFGISVLIYFKFIDGGIKPVIDIKYLVTTKQEYKYGEMLQVMSSYCRNHDVKVNFQWKLIDHIVILFPESQKDLTRGCYDNKISDIQTLTKSVPAGEYHLEADIYYTINPLRTIHYVFTTNNFTIK